MDSGLFAHLDFYCERTGPEIWAEPVNALTNLAFIAAGIWGLRAVRRRGTDLASEVLCWWVIGIGIGSALFHTFATELTKWADVVPIVGFTLVYSLFSLRRFAGMAWTAAIAVFFGFYVVVVMMSAATPEWLRIASNGTTSYLAPFLAFIFFGGLLLVKGHPAGRYKLVGAMVFVVSLAFRIVDLVVCDGFPLGTHFLWHLLNGLMLGILLASVARYGAPTPQRDDLPMHVAPANRQA